MILDDYKDINLDTENDRSMKIFNKSNCEYEAMHNDDIFLGTDDSNIKIFVMSE